MAIYDFSKAGKSVSTSSNLVQGQLLEEEIPASAVPESKATLKDKIFSGAAARLFFLLLVVGDMLWVCYAVLQLLVAAIGWSVTGGKTPFFKTLCEKAWLTLRRALICGVCLMIALFSPTFGIMIACTYFLMYDKSGIEEVVPASLQEQFKEFLPKE